MKSKLLLLSILMLLMVTTNYAQSSASLSGIAVQGIARDNNNTARTNATITLEFTIYNPTDAGNPVYKKLENLTTDAFGVFSYILDVPPSTNSKFYNKNLWLKINEGTTIISDEVFKHVPYAISANNGVPTGSIMPYIGSEAPEGWVLCDGRALRGIDGSEQLVALLGSNFAPNLGGMFLRATGGSGDHIGPDLMNTQDDGIKSHLHEAGPNLLTAIDREPNHKHEIGRNHDTVHINEGGSFNFLNKNVYVMLQDPGNDDSSGGGAHDHQHKVEGRTAETGGNETRPVSYGVNYIIKL